MTVTTEKSILEQDDLLNNNPDLKYPSLLVVTENGFGKHTFLGQYRKTARAANGVKTLNMTTKTGKPVLIQILYGGEEKLVITTKNGITICLDPNQIPQVGRVSQGVKLIKLDGGDNVISGGLG
jgi:DNA gyrase subunit A